MKSIVIGGAKSVPGNLFRILARRWQRHAAHLSDPYRPERHYMRGPGPKWHEKHGLSAGTLH
jgi:hypothetical protein